MNPTVVCAHSPDHEKVLQIPEVGGSHQHYEHLAAGLSVR